MSKCTMDVRVVKQSKGGGRYRTIYIPTASRQAALRRTAQQVIEVIQSLDCDHLHGFMPLRSPVTNALAHVGFEYTLSMDLTDFFDSVTVGMLSSLSQRYSLRWDHLVLDRLTHDGALRQGFCSSPVVANLAAMGLDHRIKEIMAGLEMAYGAGARSVYTRYADDLCVSANDPSVIGSMKVAIEVLAGVEGFTVNSRKTSIQMAKAGRRMICGVAVDRDGIYCPRAIRRRLRAARHKASFGSSRAADQAAGLAEWSKLKVPCLGRKGREHADKLYGALREEKYQRAMTLGFLGDCVLGETVSALVRERVVNRISGKLDKQYGDGRGKKETIQEEDGDTGSQGGGTLS